MRRINPNGQQGFSYVMLMMAIVVMGIAMSVAARQWKTMVQRELEADLLAKGIEIQSALALYSSSMKSGRIMPGEVYPQTLGELTKQPKPFLRNVYGDPITHGEWDLVRSPAGGIMGVRSKSKSKPIKEREFPLAVRHFEGKRAYADWIFQFPNPSMGASVMANPLGPPQLPGTASQGAPTRTQGEPTPAAGGTNPTLAAPPLPNDTTLQELTAPPPMPSGPPSNP